MYGVCLVHNDFGGGGGSYVGGVCRTTYRWWNGSQWIENPVYEGPFSTEEQAKQFAKSRNKTKGHHYFWYKGNDVFGEQPGECGAV